jgi:hypothetical protein
MYQLHSEHLNPEPEVISSGKMLHVSSYHPGWCPLWIAKGFHDFQVKSKFEELDIQVNTSRIAYEILPYEVERTDYPRSLHNYVLRVR